VIVVDDHSSDDTADKVQLFKQEYPQFSLELIVLKETSTKKSAITAAVSASASEWIITTDADIEIPSNEWLSCMMAHAVKDVNMLCGPVIYTAQREKRLFDAVAELESVGLMAIAVAGIESGYPIFCNGANLAFRKSAFEKVNGYMGAMSTMSGDDTALMLKLAPQAVRFVRDKKVVVIAVPPADGIGFIRQHQRWASKIPTCLSGITLFISVAAWMAHAGFLMCAIGAIVGTIDRFVFISIWTSTGFVEYMLLKAAGEPYDRRISSVLILMLQPIYALAVTVIGITAVFLPYRWKGRTGR
jgi:cellulose synthase/poly-beta-1,6-N-acetylglucosamine synthase-like glycosyltransferase